MVTPRGLVVLTDRRLAAGSLPAVVEAAVRGGCAWVILREKDLPGTRRRALADELRALLPPGHLIVAGPDPLGGSAVHLAAADPIPSGGELSLIGRSCHSPVVSSDVDYVTLSPIFPTATKPGYGPPLGVSVLAGGVAPRPEAPFLAGGVAQQLGAAVPAGGVVPRLALGGVDSAERAAACARAGAAGIAVLGAIMRAPDPEAVARELSAAFDASSHPDPQVPRRRSHTHAAEDRCGE